MPDTIPALTQWAATLPQYAATTPSLTYKYERDGVPRYLLEGDGPRAVFKHYRATDAPRRHAFDRKPAEEAGAEAAALQLYAPSSLAPQLIWEGEMPPEIGGYGLVYRWVDGLQADMGLFTANDAELLADALWRVHHDEGMLEGVEGEGKLVSPHSRNLEDWWLRAHEQYRDLSTHLQNSMPPQVEEAFTRLLQSVAGDANAHRRFWGTSKLVPVHGSTALYNVILAPQSVTLVDWSRYGLGDATYELANTVWDMAIAGREQYVEQLVEPYIQRADNVMLERRLQIYRRILPFGRLLDLISRLAEGKTVSDEERRRAEYYMSASMQVYNVQAGSMEQVLPLFREWLARTPEVEAHG